MVYLYIHIERLDVFEKMPGENHHLQEILADILQSWSRFNGHVFDRIPFDWIPASWATWVLSKFQKESFPLGCPGTEVIGSKVIGSVVFFHPKEYDHHL